MVVSRNFLFGTILGGFELVGMYRVAALRVFSGTFEMFLSIASIARLKYMIVFNWNFL